MADATPIGADGLRNRVTAVPEIPCVVGTSTGEVEILAASSLLIPPQPKEQPMWIVVVVGLGILVWTYWPKFW